MLTIKNASVGKLLVLLIAIAFAAGCMPPGPRALLDGKELIERGDYREAIETLRQAASLLSTNAQAWNYLGIAYHCAGQGTNAAQAYEKALALDRDLMEAHYNLGCLRIEQNRFELAKSELTTFTVFRRNSPEGWIKLATAQLRSVRPGPPSIRAAELGAAEKSYREALRLSPGNPEALNGLGLLEIQRNRPRDAAQDFTSAIKQKPDYAPGVLNMAIVSQVYLNDRPAALRGYREYLSLPDHALDAAEVQATARELDQEINPPARPTAPAAPVASSAGVAAETQPAPRTSPPPPAPASTQPPPNRQRAETPPPAQKKVDVVNLSEEPAVKVAQDSTPRVQPGPQSSATAGTESTKTAKPGFFSRMNPLNMLHHQARTNSQPSRLAQKNHSSQDSSAARDSASELGVRSPAYRYQSLPRPAPGDAAAAEKEFTQGYQSQQSGRISEAIRSYGRATQLDPADYEAYFNLGLAATSAGNVGKALDAYEHALAIQPDSPDARYNFAMLLKRAGYLADAMNELHHLRSAYPADPRAYLALGNIYAQTLRQPARARDEYLKVLEVDPHNAQSAAIREWMVANPP